MFRLLLCLCIFRSHGAPMHQELMRELANNAIQLLDKHHMDPEYGRERFASQSHIIEHRDEDLRDIFRYLTNYTDCFLRRMILMSPCSKHGFKNPT